jgi:hypothetical protein
MKGATTMGDDKAKDWREGGGKKDRIKRLLQKTSVPLETRALHAVKNFCDSHAANPLRASYLGPVMWRATDDDAYREVDAAALLYEAMAFEHVQISVEAYYYLEAKYREGIEWFAFDSPQSARIPIASNVAFSPSIETIYDSASENMPVHRMAALQTGDGVDRSNTPKSTPEKENLTQNAAAALADLVLHVVGHTLLRPPPFPPKAVPHQQKALAAFSQSIRDDLEWRDCLSDFLRTIPTTDHQDFLNAAPGPYTITLRFFIPMLVVNGRLNHVEMEEGVIQDMVPMPFAVAGARLPGWPGKDVFLNPSSHFPIFVTDVEGIPSAMQSAYDQIVKIRDAFVAPAANRRLNSVALESAVTAAVLKAYATETPRLRELEMED